MLIQSLWALFNRYNASRSGTRGVTKLAALERKHILSSFSCKNTHDQGGVMQGASVRWMIRRDMGDVLAIENQVFDNPWTEEEFIRSLRQRNVIGMVAECCESVVGYMIYELHKNRLHLLNFAVCPAHKRTGVGRAMIAKLISKLSPERRNRIMLEVRETNLDAQLFFRAMGFRAISVLRDFYEDSPEDAYLMQYRYKSEASQVVCRGEQ